MRAVPISLVNSMSVSRGSKWRAPTVGQNSANLTVESKPVSCGTTITSRKLGLTLNASDNPNLKLSRTLKQRPKLCPNSMIRLRLLWTFSAQIRPASPMCYHQI